jgi:hypothetical protein
MKVRTGIAVLILALGALAGSFVFMIGNQRVVEAAKAEKATPTTTNKEPPSAKPMAPNANMDIVYYFMTTQRCISCMRIEAYTKETVQQKFADALKKGTLVWRMVNVNQPENNHFIKDYRLYTKSVVVVKIRSGRQVEWKNLDKVWELLTSKNAFQSYIAKELTAFREKG